MDDVREAIHAIQHATKPIDKARAEAWLIATAEGGKTQIDMVEDDKLHGLVARMQDYGMKNDFNFPTMADGDDYIEMMYQVADGSIENYFYQFDDLDAEGWALYKDIRAYSFGH